MQVPSLSEQTHVRTRENIDLLGEALLGFDPGRAVAACEILAEYADRFQILVLTARPELLEFPKGTEVKEIKLGPPA